MAELYSTILNIHKFDFDHFSCWSYK